MLTRLKFKDHDILSQGTLWDSFMLTCHNWLLALWRAKEFSKEISRVRFKSLAKFFVETTVKIVMLSLKKLAPKVYRILNFTKVKDFFFFF